VLVLAKINFATEQTRTNVVLVSYTLNQK